MKLEPKSGEEIINALPINSDVKKFLIDNNYSFHYRPGDFAKYFVSFGHLDVYYFKHLNGGLLSVTSKDDLESLKKAIKLGL